MSQPAPTESFIVERPNPNTAIVHVGAFDLDARIDEHGVAWFEAEPLGAWLGASRARDARALAKNLKRGKILNDSEYCEAVSQKTGVRGRRATLVWLTRSGALKLAARSDTPRAAQLLDLIVRAFEPVLDGRFGPPPVAPALPDLIAEVVDLRAQVATLTRAFAAPRGLLGPSARTEVDARLRALAAQLVRVQGQGKRASCLRHLRNKLETAMGWRDSFELFPASPARMSKLYRALRRLERDVAAAVRLGPLKPAAAQPELFPKAA